MTFLDSLTGIDFVYIIVGLVFTTGAGGVMFAFALSYISQKMAMWIDVMKIVKHRNALVQEVTALKTHIQTIESMSGGAKQKQEQVISPTDIGVQSVTFKDKP